jgi:hypothetical protein
VEEGVLRSTRQIKTCTNIASEIIAAAPLPVCASRASLKPAHSCSPQSPLGMEKTSWAFRGSSDCRRLSSCLVLLVVALLAANFSDFTSHSTPAPPHAASIIARCRSLKLVPGTVPDRQYSDRFVPGTKPTLLKNAKIWTGSHNGTHVIYGNILLDKGLIQSVGEVDLASLSPDTVVVDVKDAWVTPGIVDLHSHIGLSPLPGLDGAQDTNSFRGPAQPWLRSLDALHTHSDAFPLSIAGGVTSALVLPGSAGTIGQAFRIFDRSIFIT